MLAHAATCPTDDIFEISLDVSRDGHRFTQDFTRRFTSGFEMTTNGTVCVQVLEGTDCRTALALLRTAMKALESEFEGLVERNSGPPAEALPDCVVCGKPMEVEGRVRYCESKGLMPSHSTPACSGDPKAKTKAGGPLETATNG